MNKRAEYRLYADTAQTAQMFREIKERFGLTFQGAFVKIVAVACYAIFHGAMPPQGDEHETE